MSKYAPLRRRLESEPGPTLEVTFAEVDAIVGGLPASARRHSAWWSNEEEGTHVQARAWMHAGWRVEAVDRRGERVRFVRR